MKKFVLAAVTTIGFAAPTLPVFADTLSQSLMQAELDKCLANGTITMQDVQGMTDDQLEQALDQCSQISSSASAQSAPVAQPAVVAEPIYSRQPAYVSQPVAVAPAPVADQGSGSGGNSIDFGGIANGIASSFQPGDGGIGGSGSGGGQGGAGFPGGLGGGGGIGGGQGGVANIPTNPDVRIANMQNAINEGIKTGAMTPAEAAAANAQLGKAEADNSIFGNSALGQLKVNQELDKTAANINTELHNNVGLPNSQINALAASDNHSLIRDRIAALKGGNSQSNAFSKFQGRLGGDQTALNNGAGGNSAFDRFKQRMAERQFGGLANAAGGGQSNAFAKFKERLAMREGASNGIGGGNEAGGLSRFTQRFQQHHAFNGANVGHGRSFIQRVRQGGGGGGLLARALRGGGHRRFALR